MDTEIDLGVKDSERYGDMKMAVSAPMSGSDKSEKSYPSFHYSGPMELELPDEGMMEIHFVKRSETSSVRKDGKHWYECDIEVRCICEVEDAEEDDQPTPPSTRDRSAEDALDEIAKVVSARNQESSNGSGYQS